MFGPCSSYPSLILQKTAEKHLVLEAPVLQATHPQRQFGPLLLLTRRHRSLFEMDEPTRCTICQEDILANERTAQGQTCHHVFHVRCLRKLRRYQGTCPVCRSQLTDPTAQEPGGPPEGEVGQNANDEDSTTTSSSPSVRSETHLAQPQPLAERLTPEYRRQLRQSLHGMSREERDWLSTNETDEAIWLMLHPNVPFYDYVPTDERQLEVWEFRHGRSLFEQNAHLPRRNVLRLLSAFPEGYLLDLRQAVWADPSLHQISTHLVTADGIPISEEEPDEEFDPERSWVLSYRRLDEAVLRSLQNEGRLQPPILFDLAYLGILATNVENRFLVPWFIERSNLAGTRLFRFVRICPATWNFSEGRVHEIDRAERYEGQRQVLTVLRTRPVGGWYGWMVRRMLLPNLATAFEVTE